MGDAIVGEMIAQRSIQDRLWSMVRERRLPRKRIPHGANFGYCPVCEHWTLFVATGPWLRDHYFCLRCASVPRFRALMHVLETHVPDWRSLEIHESSPGGASSQKLAHECSRYQGTHFYSDAAPGEMRAGFRCENLECQTFADESFDLVVTQDVFEHVLHPDRAFAEVARTLRPGGCHVFTVPWYYWQDTVVRAVEENGRIKHLHPPQYHGNPIDPNGSLVVTEWGRELCDVIYAASGMSTTVVRLRDRRMGIDGKFIEIFISTKPRAARLAPADCSANATSGHADPIAQAELGMAPK